MKKRCVILLMMVASSVLADPITLYQKSNTDSQTIGHYDVTTLKPFFSKDGWTKAGDTQTGEVGWVKTSEFKQHRKRQVEAQAKKEAEAAEKQFEQQYNQSNQRPSQQPIHRKTSIEAKVVSYDADPNGGRVEVTRQWTDEDGKVHQKSYEIPLESYRKQHKHQHESAHQGMYQQLEQYMKQMMHQMSQGMGGKSDSMSKQDADS